jgi:hypothetical protein
MSPKWLRRVTAGATTSLLLTAVGALTGVASPDAEAADFSLTQGKVSVQLTQFETDLSADGRDGAGLICTFDVVPLAQPYQPVTQATCERALVWCATAARTAGVKALVTFYPGRETCEGR